MKNLPRRPETSWRSCARGATMGGSGSRLSKELLAEYQVRGTPVPVEFARGPALGSGVPGRAAERARPPGVS